MTGLAAAFDAQNRLADLAEQDPAVDGSAAGRGRTNSARASPGERIW